MLKWFGKRTVGPLQGKVTQSWVGRSYAELEPVKRWELLYDHTYVVMLETGVRRGRDVNLVGVSTADLVVRWEIGGELDSPDQYDGVVNVYVRGGALWAGTWSGFAFRINPETGEIIETVCTR
jgi:hypothetical protein